MTRRCRIPNCPTPAERRNICRRHHDRIRRHGDPTHHEWQTADPEEVALAATERRLLPGLTLLERRLLGQHLTQLGITAAEIARITGVTPRTVYRWRAAARTQPTPA